jgi:Ala-tRNA(Pro) deacylase
MTAQMTAEGADALTIHERLLKLLDDGHAHFRLIDHPPEGRTRQASELRGHPLCQAAKCIVARVKHCKIARYMLAVIPGDRRIDFDLLRLACGATRVGFADAATAERLSCCISGTIIPFSFTPELHLVVDPALLLHQSLFFNATRLDQSIELATRDYLDLSQPRIAHISRADILHAEDRSVGLNNPG